MLLYRGGAEPLGGLKNLEGLRLKLWYRGSDIGCHSNVSYHLVSQGHIQIFYLVPQLNMQKLVPL